MKKKIFALVLGISLFASGIAAASSQWGQYRGMEIVRVLVNGTEIHPEVAAHIEDGSTFLPIRAVSEALGAKVNWNPDTYTATVDMPKGQVGLSLAQLNKIGESVGEVYALDSSGNYVEQGSGFLLSNGFFITCYHVASKGQTLRIDLNGKSYTINGEYLFYDQSADLVAVKVNADASALEFTNALPGYGAHVYSLGFPHGKFQINDGTVLVSSPIEITDTAKTAPGSSGGILIGDDGRIVGVTSAGAKSPSVDYNESIPMIVLQKEFDKLVK